jgi:carbon-monoxide dehydrogenase small subunit
VHGVSGRETGAVLFGTGSACQRPQHTTLEGLQEEAAEFGGFIADQGAEQCGFCNPGFIMNALALFRENPYPSEEEVKEYLSGNLCRCSGYEGQLRGIMNFLAWKKQKEAAE